MGATLVALMMHYAALCIIKTLEQERHAIDAVLRAPLTMPTSALVFVPLVVGFYGQGHEPVGNTTPKSGMPTRVFNSKHRADSRHHTRADTPVLLAMGRDGQGVH